MVRFVVRLMVHVMVHLVGSPLCAATAGPRGCRLEGGRRGCLLDPQDGNMGLPFAMSAVSLCCPGGVEWGCRFSAFIGVFVFRGSALRRVACVICQRRKQKRTVVVVNHWPTFEWCVCRGMKKNYLVLCMMYFDRTSSVSCALNEPPHPAPR